ncbi:PAS-domain containing protein [Muricoccus vinaceus]|uniref:histidine kinase n=1 Tax=Muricoccus vinaceus TaxID=424704 RepID=A0ABV6ITI8_9PROT
MDLLSAAGRRLRRGRSLAPAEVVEGGLSGVPAANGPAGMAPATAGSVAVSAAPDSRDSKADRLEAVLSGMTDGVMMIDAELRLVEWNARFPDFTGIPKDLLRVGLPMEEILRAQAQAGEFGEVNVEAEVARRLERLRTGASSGTIERRRPDGRVMELRRNPLADGGFVTLYTDITARRQAEDQLRQAQKMEAIGHLTGGVAHDFNNLLMVILGNLDRAERSLRDLDLDRVGRGIEQARSGAQRAAALTQRLLAISRRQAREPRPVDVNALITGMADLIRQSTAGSNAVEFTLADCPWVVLADPHQFEIALLNLVINARDAMPHGGAVLVESAKVRRGGPGAPDPIPIPGDEFMRVTVRDTGAGMSPEVAARACEPFFTTKEPGKGTGLGLYQVVDFVTQAGGHLVIDSQFRAGTAVTILIPRLLVPMPDGVQAWPGDADRLIGHGEAVLVVEDEPDILSCTTEGLEALGYHALGARDASTALTVLETRPDVALLFTDLVLPGITGRQLAAEASRRWPGLAVLTTSGGPAEAPPEEGAPPASYISKPYQLPGLSKAIRAVLDTRVAVPARPAEGGGS